MPISGHLLLIIAALVCLGLLTANVPARINLLALTAFFLVLAVFIVV
jgi:hypothetical protein